MKPLYQLLLIPLMSIFYSCQGGSQEKQSSADSTQVNVGTVVGNTEEIRKDTLEARSGKLDSQTNDDFSSVFEKMIADSLNNKPAQNRYNLRWYNPKTQPATTDTLKIKILMVPEDSTEFKSLGEDLKLSSLLSSSAF